MCWELGWRTNLGLDGQVTVSPRVTQPFWDDPLLFPSISTKWKWGIPKYWVLSPLCCFPCVSCQSTLWNVDHWAKLISSMKALPAMFQFTCISLNRNILVLKFCLPCLFWRWKLYCCTGLVSLCLFFCCCFCFLDVYYNTKGWSFSQV